MSSYRKTLGHHGEIVFDVRPSRTGRVGWTCVLVILLLAVGSAALLA